MPSAGPVTVDIMITTSVSTSLHHDLSRDASHVISALAVVTRIRRRRPVGGTGYTPPVAGYLSKSV